jgi:hypothetical protein
MKPQLFGRELTERELVSNIEVAGEKGRDSPERRGLRLGPFAKCPVKHVELDVRVDRPGHAFDVRPGEGNDRVRPDPAG